MGKTTTEVRNNNVNIYNIASDVKYATIKSMKKKRVRREPTSTATLLRAYRFDSRLITAFEADCLRHLRNPRIVVEALMQRSLAADPKEPDAIATEYQQRVFRRTRVKD